MIDLVRALGSPGGLADPYPLYHEMRREAPVFWVPYDQYDGGRFIITRYDLADAVLKDSRICKDASRMGYQEGTVFGKSMLFQDPPDHTRLRGLVNRGFTPAMVAQLAPRVREIVDFLLDDVIGVGPADFMTAFAMPLPVIVIAEILGVPAEDRAQFREWSRVLIAGTDVLTASPETESRSMEATMQLASYFDGLIRERRRHPGVDLVSTLAALEEADGDRLSHEELLGMCVLLLVAGHETTMNLLGNGLFALVARPDEMGRLRRDKTLIEPAVEDMLRYDAPVQQGTFRYAGEAVELAGVRMEPGQTVAVMLGAANRDPEQFPDPDRFDVARRPNRHLSFGRGIHVCLGAPVARLEGRMAWTRILERTSSIELDGTPIRRPNSIFRGFDALPVRFS